MMFALRMMYAFGANDVARNMGTAFAWVEGLARRFFVFKNGLFGVAFGAARAGARCFGLWRAEKKRQVAVVKFVFGGGADKKCVKYIKSLAFFYILLYNVGWQKKNKIKRLK